MTLNTVKGFLDNTEGNELAKIARKCSDLGPCLEIGTYCGKSALIIGEACRKSNNLLFTVDHHTGSEEHQLGEEYHDSELYDENISSFNTLPEFLENLKKSDLKNYILPLIGASKELAKEWKLPLGMVFIDGGHSYQTTLNDLEIVYKKMKGKKGTIVCDDYQDASYITDVKKAIDYYVKKEKLSLRIIEGKFAVIDI